MMSSEKTNNSRRDFLVKSMALIPTVVIGGAGAGAIGVGVYQRRRRSLNPGG